MPHRPNRRDLIRMSAAALAGAAATRSHARPDGPIHVRSTAGSERFAEQPALNWKPRGAGSAGDIVLNPSATFQEVLGFGAAFTDAACFTFNQLAAEPRRNLFHELFSPSEMGFSVCRLCIGSSDYSSKVYSYDDGEPDPELKRFSIEHDREYILPALRAAREVNRDLFLFGSPWSPPGWMKANGSMLGGSMRKKYFPAYAAYLKAFLEAYSAAGVPVDALTVQNELDTDQDGNMPACLWGQEYETEFISTHLGPKLAAAGIGTKIWLLDHNYNLWGRAIAELDEPAVNRYVDGVAWHGYLGEPSAMTRVHQAHPEKHMYWTEGGSDYTDPRYTSDWARWSSTFAGILRNWARTIVGWNLALDEKGKPNIGPFSCGGLVTVHSRTKEISRSGMYWAMAHYSRAVRRGARRIDSTGTPEGVAHVAFSNTDGSFAAVLTNTGKPRTVLLALPAAQAEVNLPGDSITTLTWA